MNKEGKGRERKRKREGEGLEMVHEHIKKERVEDGNRSNRQTDRQTGRKAIIEKRGREDIR